MPRVRRELFDAPLISHMHTLSSLGQPRKKVEERRKRRRWGRREVVGWGWEWGEVSKAFQMKRCVKWLTHITLCVHHPSKPTLFGWKLQHSNPDINELNGQIARQKFTSLKFAHKSLPTIYCYHKALNSPRRFLTPNQTRIPPQNLDLSRNKN